MNVLLALVVVVVSSALAITAILLVRRRAPEGSHFAHGDLAASVVRMCGPAAPPAPADAEQERTATHASGRSRRGWNKPQQPRAQLRESRTKLAPEQGLPIRSNCGYSWETTHMNAPRAEL